MDKEPELLVFFKRSLVKLRKNKNFQLKVRSNIKLKSYRNYYVYKRSRPLHFGLSFDVAQTGFFNSYFVILETNLGFRFAN